MTELFARKPYWVTTMDTSDMDKIIERWGGICGTCDYGLPTTCTCPKDIDPRPVIAALVTEVVRLRKVLGDRS